MCLDRVLSNGLTLRETYKYNDNVYIDAEYFACSYVKNKVILEYIKIIQNHKEDEPEIIATGFIPEDHYDKMRVVPLEELFSKKTIKEIKEVLIELSEDHYHHKRDNIL